MQTSNMKLPHLPSGTEDFAEMISQLVETENVPFTIADKTTFLPKILKSGNKVTVFTRPIRFMKSSTLSMIERFTSIQDAESNKSLFEGLAINNEEYTEFRKEYQGQFPVIHITLKNVDEGSWSGSIKIFGEIMAELYEKHSYVLSSLTKRQQSKYEHIMNEEWEDGDLASALANMATYLSKYYNKKVIILIDEYDTPLYQAYLNTKVEQCDDSYFELMSAFMRRFLGRALKGHLDVEKSIMTGVLPTAFTSIVSALNNTTLYSVLSSGFTETFGFTENEVSGFVEQIEGVEVTDKAQIKKRLQDWYNGYYIGNKSIRMYNPWSVAQFFKRLEDDNERGAEGAYWIQVGNSLAIPKHLEPRFERIYPQLSNLMLNKPVRVELEEITSLFDLNNTYNDSSFWSLLLHAGYLSASNIQQDNANILLCDIAIPNYEVKGAYAQLIKRYQERFDPGGHSRNAMTQALITGNIKNFSTCLQKFMEQVASCHDMSKNDGYKIREQVYHAFLLGLLANLNSSYFQTSSNRESGYGRYDIALMPRNKHGYGFIFEIKSVSDPKKLQQEAKNALSQIEEKSCGSVLEAHDVKESIYIGISFYGKRFNIAHKKVSAAVTT